MSWDEKSRQALDAARARGRKMFRDLLAANAEVLNQDTFLARTGLTREALAELVDANKVLCIDCDGESGYPVWQIVGGGFSPLMPAVIAAAKSHKTTFIRLRVRDGAFGCRHGYDLLRDGESDLPDRITRVFEMGGDCGPSEADFEGSKQRP